MIKKKDKEELKQLLQENHNKLVHDADSMEKDVHSGATGGDGVTFNHLADAGSDTYELDFSMEQLENKENLIYQIEEALKKFDTNTFGNCETCEKQISIERLKAIPFATNCIQCQEDMETN